jgi:hypothetical protein
MRLVTALCLILLLVGLPSGLAAQTITPIKDIQTTTDPSGDSPMKGQVVTITGRVTGEASSFGRGYYVQDAAEPWSGIFVRDTANKPARGDSVVVTGTVNESFGLTRIEDVTAFEIAALGKDLPFEKRMNPFDPIVITLAEANPGEQYESVLVRIENVWVSNENPDAPNDFGEWVVTDGTDTLRVDDAGDYYYTPALDDTIAYIVGLLNFSFSNWKLEPRISNDIGPVNGAWLISSVQQVLPGDDTPYVIGDTLKVVGIVEDHPRSLWVGARWSMYAVMGEAMPWSGIQIIQHDTVTAGVGATNITAVQPGDRVVFTGRVEEFQQHSQLALLTNPPVPVEFLDFDNPLPDPISISGDELTTIETGEKYEGVLVRIDEATVINNDVTGNGSQMLIQDVSSGANVLVDDQYQSIRLAIQGGTFSWPAIGTRIRLTGVVRHLGGGGYAMNPRSEADLEILAVGPSIADVTRDKTAPTSSEDVIVSAKIKAVDAAVTDATLGYSVNFGDFTVMSMTAANDTVYEATIPAQNDGDFVMYYITATDADGDVTITPDTTTTMFFYTVRDAGLTIYDIQFTPFEAGVTGYEGLEVTVSGVVTMAPADFSPPGSNTVPGTYYIQDGSGPWTGILVSDPDNTPSRGDLVTITGIAEERFSVTRINDVSSFTVVSSGNPLPDPVVQTTGNVTTGADSAEAYESVLIEFHNVVVSNPFPDAPSNFGEFAVDDGTGSIRVDDGGNWAGNLDSTFAQGDSIRVLRGVHFYSFGNYKLMPRGEDDVIGHIVTNVDRRADSGLPDRFVLYANYPNPFNPSTTIRFELPKNVPVQLTIHNLLGQRIRTLVDATKAPGAYSVMWDGRDSAGVPVASGVYFYRLKAGSFVETKKMLMVK